ncbi:YwmB family TATA-box binding protein [Lederbergia citrea]|uniref:YwmB family TATA-box binding protein n=1 Tax=Lederbergia citrea TaxID=2833581 RepID=UPI001BC96C66|nr:YwmB family TATA-box binding protein [Lederbergia citrea]MBS4178068.1 YwmB family TATA-box binding protein [Lederbergia citrea]MBS4204734.1 YwmB family TATA-box binding protein [Lederbergia citrea]
MKNRQFFILVQLILSFGFIIIFIGNNTNAAQISTDVDKLAQLIKSHNGAIIEWSLYARESVYLSSKDEWLTKGQQLEEQYPDMQWSTSFATDTVSIIGYIDHGAFSETIKIISTDKNRQSSSYIIYEAKGSSWDTKETANQVAQAVNPKVDALFDKKPIIFSCIKGEFSEELNEFRRFSLDGFLQSLQAKEIESVKEGDFYSLSGYSSLFAQSLSLPNQQMNMQIGLRKNEMGPGTTIVVGTPILTIEY